jgi:biopolymer transport protein ExbB/TolQ
MQKLGEILMVAGIVAIPLLLFSIVAIALIVERITFWIRIHHRQERIVREALRLYREEPTLATKTTSVMAGISEALTSTAFGLVVAVFTLFFANTFRGFYLHQLALIQEHAAELELLHRRRRKSLVEVVAHATTSQY